MEDYSCPNCGTPHGRNTLKCPKCNRRLDQFSMDYRPADVGAERAVAPLYSPTIEPGAAFQEPEGPPSGAARPAESGGGFGNRADHDHDPYDMDPRPIDTGAVLPAAGLDSNAPVSRRISRPVPVSEPPREKSRRADGRQVIPVAQPPAVAKSKSASPAAIEPPRTSASRGFKRESTVDFGFDTDMLREGQQWVLQIFGQDGQWHRFKPFDGKGIKIGSGERSERFPALRTMAARHFRLKPDGSKVIVTDLESLNGVFRRIKEPTFLNHGARFRIGQFLIEFRTGTPAPEVAAATKDGEELYCLDFSCAGFLVLIRPDGEDGLTIPLTKTETVLGRERPDTGPIDIHLPSKQTSGRHARIVRENGQFMLENLSKSVGTFVKVDGEIQITAEEEILAGKVKFRVIPDSA